jgi:hypothetical protein
MELDEKNIYIYYLLPLVVALFLFNAWKEKQRVW